MREQSRQANAGKPESHLRGAYGALGIFHALVQAVCSREREPKVTLKVRIAAVLG